MANKQDVDLKFTLIDQVTKSLGAIQKSVSDVGTTLTKVNQAAELAGKAFNFAAGAAAKIGDAVSGAAALEDALARVGVRTNATTEEQIALQQAVESAVGATTFSAQEAAAALALLAEDGFSANDAAAQLTETLVFANAAAIDAAEATGLLGTVLDKFAASPDEISGIADALTATAAAAGASTKAITEGLAGIGTAAKTANVSIEDSVAILGTLAVEGVESSAAVGRLNKIFQDFAEPASKFSIAIKDAGLGGLEFVEVVKALQKDSTAASAVLATLGDKPREAMRLLLQEGGSDLASFTTIIENSGGAAQAAADKIAGTFNFALSQLRNKLDLARTSLATPVLEPLTAELQRVTKVVSDFAESEDFDAIAKNVGVFATNVVASARDVATAFDFSAILSATVSFATEISAVLRGITITLKDVATEARLVASAFTFLNEAVKASTLDLYLSADANKEAAKWSNVQALAAEIQAAKNKLASESVASVGDAATYAEKPVERLTATTEAYTGVLFDAQDGTDAFGNSLAESLEKFAPVKKSLEELNAEFDAAVKELRRVQEAYKVAFESGSDGAEAAFAAVKKAGSEVARLRKELDTTKISAEELQAAFKDVGLKSQKDLIAEAEKARKAFELITQAVKDGGAAQADVARAFEVYASRLRETADGADEATKKQIAQQIELAGTTAGVSRELINAQTAGLGLGDAIQKSGDKAEKALEGVQKSAVKTAETLVEAQKATDSYATANNSMAAAVDGAGGAMDALAQVTVGYLGTVKDGALILENNIDANGRMASALRDQFEATNPLARAKRLQEEAEAALNAQREKSEKLIAAEIAQLEAQDPKIREENALRAQLAARFGENADGLDRLIALRQKEREEREASLAVGQQELAQNQQLVATQPKPGNTNNVTINVNIAGSQDSQAYWRRIVSEFILPELKRLERLEQ